MGGPGGTEPPGEGGLRDHVGGGGGLGFGGFGLLDQLFVDHFGGLVDERAGTEHDLDRVGGGELAAGSRDPALARQGGYGDVPRQAPLQPQQPLEVRAQDQLLQVPVDEHLDRFFAEAVVVALRLTVFGAGAGDQRAGRRARTQGQRERHPARRQQDRREQHRSRAPRGASRERGQQPGAHSIPRGPTDSPDRNWRTNGFSDANSSWAGPDSTILPFHSTEMCSATRRALMMSWVITT